MSTPSISIPDTSASTTTTTPSQADDETNEKLEESEQTRKQQIMNMHGRTSTIGTSSLGDTSSVNGFKVSLLGGE